MNRNTLFAYVQAQYGISPEFLWETAPTSAVLRHPKNRKWFAAVLTVQRARLGLAEEGSVDVLNVKVDPAMVGSLQLRAGIYPAYHMNKLHWISILLDDRAPHLDDTETYALLQMSYTITK